uniref:Uncharacterized protein n=1 Tax=Candidatus Kentrum sp. LFY TaxID=2126342 RepID=A0A450U5E5_9GAMM|nr:MAG: hypothetical protein BECKLFY1418B_GA0070995_100310 [Candidatus Kentron sp. LFY]
MNMLALRARTEAGWVLAYAPILSESLFFRYLNTRSEGSGSSSLGFPPSALSPFGRDDDPMSDGKFLETLLMDRLVSKRSIRKTSGELDHSIPIRNPFCKWFRPSQHAMDSRRRLCNKIFPGESTKRAYRYLIFFLE